MFVLAAMGDHHIGHGRRTGQPVPEGHGDLARCVMESLALSYRYTLDRMAKMLGRTYRTLHVVGGGSQNALLCRFTADATGSAQEIRDIVRASTDMTEYEPQDPAYWRERYGEFLDLLAR